MPLSKARKQEYMRRSRQAKKRLAGVHLLSSVDVRAMRKAGIKPEELEGEQGLQVSFQVFSALQRDRDALKAHLGWHHESMKNPDVGTIVERVLAVGGLEEVKKWVISHEAEHIVRETEAGYVLGQAKRQTRE